MARALVLTGVLVLIAGLAVWSPPLIVVGPCMVLIGEVWRYEAKA